MTYPPPYYGQRPPAPPKSNGWIVWLVMGIVGVLCCLPSAAWVAFNPEGTGRILKAVFSLFGG